MNKFSQVCLILCSSSGLFLTGCQHLTQTKPYTSTQIHSENQFHLQGKIGVRTPQKSGSAFFTWVQQQQNFNIELTGILGVGKTQIQGLNGKVTLNSANTGSITASSPEELLECATGWQAPISHMISWVQARPATPQAQISRDTQGRIEHIEEDGWNINLTYEGEQKQPSKLILRQSLKDNKENRITMLIQNR